MKIGFVRAALALLAGLGALAAAAPHPNWLATFTSVDNGAHRLGNPAAPVQLTEYVSYTCPHCGNFYRTGDLALRLKYVTPGQVAVTVHSFLRNPVDLAASLLADCGDPGRFWVRHRNFFATQDTWLGRIDTASTAQKQRWYAKDQGAAMRAIAADLDLYDIVAPYGVSRAEADRCLSNPAAIARFKAQHDDAVALGIDGTPEFTVNGERLVAVYDWPTLDLVLASHF